MPEPVSEEKQKAFFEKARKGMLAAGEAGRRDRHAVAPSAAQSGVCRPRRAPLLSRASPSRRRLTWAAGGAIVARGGSRRHGLAAAKGLLEFLGSEIVGERVLDANECP